MTSSAPMLGSSMSFDSDVYGSPQPRLWTPPLRELTPETSFGYDIIAFAEAIGWPLDLWQQWAAIHLGELLEDGRPRFRVVLILVARQNGKTLLARVLTLYWMFIERVPLILGTSASRDYAKESWRSVINMALRTPILADEIGSNYVRETIGEECFTNSHGSRYRFAASNRRAGRSLTIHRGILDELREHKDWEAWNASINAMNAVPDAQAIVITNQGDARSIVLDSLRDSALDYIETGHGDRRLGILEWSSPNGASPTDLKALAQANPSLGYRMDPDALLGAGMRAERAGGVELAGFRTEVMCQRVTNLDQAIDESAWIGSGTDTPIDLAQHRDQVALCLDVSLDARHATLIAAATIDGITHLEVVKAWNGAGCTRALRAELPDIVARIRPRVFGWFPNGPAAAVAAALRSKTGSKSWAPRRTVVSELSSEVTAACMGFAEQVIAGQIRHPKDEMLTAHIISTQPLKRGDAWVFTRRGSAPIDGAYGAAGAVHLARTLTPPRPRLEVVST